MGSVLLVGAGGALGAVGRYGLSLLPWRGDFPLPTLLTNLLGAVLIGFIAASVVAVPLGLFAAFAAAHIAVRILAPGADPAILPIVFVLSGIGITFVTRLAPDLAISQLIILFVSVALMVGTLALVKNLDVVMRYKYTFGIIGIILLMLPIFIGTTISGSKLWIRIAGFTIQPGEFAKVFIVLFLAGYLPGALLAIVLMIGSYIISVKENYPKGSPFTIKGFIKQLGTSIWALAAVVIVVFGVVGGVFTATESAAIAVIYSLLVSVFVYKGLDWKGVWRVLGDCIDTLSIVLILIATSSIFGYCLTQLHVPDLAATAITNFTNNPIVLALLLNLILLVLGCIMDMAPIILIATPILLPIATSNGIDPVQFGIMVVLNCGIGLLTPPVGSVLFIGSAVAKLPMEKVVKATLPFYLCMIITLLLVTFFPQFSLFLPNLFA